MGKVNTAPVVTTFGHILAPKVETITDKATGQTITKQKWQITPLFHHDDPADAASLQECYDDAFKVGVEAFGENFWQMVQQGSVRWPFRNGGDINPKTGEKRFGDGITYINCSSQNAPEVVSRYYDPASGNKKPRRVTDASEYYWGQKARVNITFKHYKREDGWGIAAYVNGVQLWHEGERMGNQFDAQEAFDAEGAPEAGAPGAPPSIGAQASAPLPPVPGGAPAGGPPAVGGPPKVGGTRSPLL